MEEQESEPLAFLQQKRSLGPGDRNGEGQVLGFGLLHQRGLERLNPNPELAWALCRCFFVYLGTCKASEKVEDRILYKGKLQS